MMSIDVMQKQPTLLHRFLPRFIDPKLERRYRDDRLHYRLTALRVSFAAGIAIWILFVALDLLTIHDPSTALFYVRIAGILSLIPFYLATFLIKPGRWIEVIGFGAVLTQILLLTALVAFLSPVSLPYYQPTEVWITIGVATFVVCGVSFIDGLILALGTVCGFLLSVTIFQPEPLLLIGFDFAWLLSVLAFVGLGSYILDRTQHITWLQEQELLRAEDQIRGLLHNVLPPSIAARKLAGESPVADSFAEASVLFADVVDFTSLSARLESPQKLACSMSCSVGSTGSVRGTGSRRSKRSAIVTWRRPEYRKSLLDISPGRHRLPSKCLMKRGIPALLMELKSRFVLGCTPGPLLLV